MATNLAIAQPQRDRCIPASSSFNPLTYTRSSPHSDSETKPNQSTKAPIWWSNAIFFLSVHVFAVIGVFFISPVHKISRLNLFLCWLYCQLGTFGVTLGYHRMWSHRAFTAIKPFRWFLAFAASFGFQGSARWWVLRHRLHHRFVDSENDPYSAKKGLLFSHVGWIFRKPTYAKLKLIDRTDLDRDSVVNFQHKYYLPISIFIGFALPHFLSTYMFDCNTHSTWDGLIWGGFVSRLVIWHSTFFINSLAHYIGEQLYDLDITARSNFWLSLFTCGEANHNYHHVFPKDYRNGPATFDWDPTKWIIYLLYTYTPLITKVHLAAPDEIEYARKRVLRLTRSTTTSSNHKVGPSNWFPSFEDLFNEPPSHKTPIRSKQNEESNTSSDESEWMDGLLDTISSSEPVISSAWSSSPDIGLTLCPSSASESDAESSLQAINSINGPSDPELPSIDLLNGQLDDASRLRNRKQSVPTWSKEKIYQHVYSHLLSKAHGPKSSPQEELENLRTNLKKSIILLIDGYLLDLTSYALSGSHPGGIKILRQHSIIRYLGSFESSLAIRENLSFKDVPTEFEAHWRSDFRVKWIDSSDAFNFELNQHSSPAKWRMKQFRIAQLSDQ
ncbi:hypothetical protein CROQUDRAFT_664710 [Cronartium quercuum f. sp. fusiforme G11]|uniref:Fatty acid desaturase domain-containing protein n=1 Tax=Cronartium quercuum f. sp. fusiforme G11 TaxID=708437 RepID=A0A9P6NAM8_9BASI|nr:hypothetical protein CROQUDRAFT_664710 [Cronartium quercuum f. sp. fusiforme G11]